MNQDQVSGLIAEFLREKLKQHFSVFDLSEQLRTLIESLPKHQLEKIVEAHPTDLLLAQFFAQYVNLEQALMKNHMKMLKEDQDGNS
jgi:hypothetical protein